MTGEDRLDRLGSDSEILRVLQEESSILEVQRQRDPPDRYTLSFRGKGIARQPLRNADVEMLDLHQIDVRLPYSYPKAAPALRWMTPIFHPNVSFSGFIHLHDIGMPWDSSVTLDVLCERLWDVARMAYFNLENATNYSAKRWIEKDCRVQFPVDARPLRERATPRASNVVRYHRSTGGSAKLPRGDTTNGILYIDEDTPTPPLFGGKGPGRTNPRSRPARRDDEDVFYIGDE